LIVLGGTLKEDISSQTEKGTVHRLPEFKPAMHTVNIKKSSRLFTILNSEIITSASVHHQAVDKLPEGTKAVAFSPDGVIEAFEYDRYPNLIAVQWHPELMLDDEDQINLFKWLVQESLSRSQRTSP
jgi:putative glutamine amidotransferase